MAYRDYICCRDCKSKFIYDGNDSIRNSLETTYGDEDAPNWTVELVCPNCLAKLERNPLMEEEVSNLARTMVKGDKSVNWLCRAIEREHGIVSSQMQHIADLEAALAKPKPFQPDWDRVAALEESLREHMAEIHRLKALAQPDIKPPKHKQAVATVFHEQDGRQQIEFITQVPVGELVRLYADPPLYHVDLMNVAVTVRNACHRAWVTSMENWRADIDLKEIVSSIAKQHKDVGKPAAYAVHQITDDDGVETWEDIFTSPDIATDTARRLSKTSGQFEAVPLYRSTGVTPCQTCESLARAVMMDQTGRDA